MWSITQRRLKSSAGTDLCVWRFPLRANLVARAHTFPNSFWVSCAYTGRQRAVVGRCRARRRDCLGSSACRRQVELPIPRATRQLPIQAILFYFEAKRKRVAARASLWETSFFVFFQIAGAAASRFGVSSPLAVPWTASSSSGALRPSSPTRSAARSMRARRVPAMIITGRCSCARARAETGKTSLSFPRSPSLSPRIVSLSRFVSLSLSRTHTHTHTRPPRIYNAKT